MADNDAKSTKVIKNYYLQQVKEHRAEGMDTYDAADAAERDTKSKYGWVPREGK